MNYSTVSRKLSDTRKLHKLLKSKPESYWVKRGETMALRLFHDMATRVPAYKDFLNKNSVKPAAIKTIEDFQRVPTLNKKNYLRLYPRDALCWDGTFSNINWTISATSGSTGKPFYFPRTDLQDEYYAISAELYLRENFQIQDKSTLYIDAFAMGVWIGGVFTYEAIKRVAKKGYALSIITPGINKAEVINAVRNLGKDFDQIIIGCYPPILKDIIDLGIEEGLDWGEYKLGMVFSAEGFSEDFRDYIIKHAKLSNSYASSLNHYGTVDLGTMSHETILTNFIRRQAINNKQLSKILFEDSTYQPTLTQYIPEMFYFEEVDKSLICSSYSGFPLVRYDLGDTGGVYKLDQVRSIFSKADQDLDAELQESNLREHIWNLPLVYVFERLDFSVTLAGANIYPEEIRKTLLEPSFEKHISGKFTLEVVSDKAMNPKLVVHVEMKHGVERSADLINSLRESVKTALITNNSEYASNYAAYGSKLTPLVKLWPTEHPLHFSGSGKQKWVKK